jgi:nucleotide-binding universal stress UspA family protein
MSYTSIQVHVQSSPEARLRLGVARALAERFDAALIGVGVEMVPPMAVSAGGAQADWYSAVSGSIEDNLTQAEAMFWEATAGLAKGGVWKHGLAFLKEALATASRGADLIVADRGPKNHKSDYRDAGAAELSVAAGRPVLVTPAEAPMLSGKKVVLAWKDAREARRAMMDALPFFKSAEAVLVLEVCDRDEEEDAKSRVEDVAASLRRHGATVEPRAIVHDGSPAEEILRQALAFDSDLIVAGAYGHTRVGEWLFGGVTRDLLEQKGHYVLLSH